MKARISIIGFIAVIFLTAWTAPVPDSDQPETASVSKQQAGEFSFFRVHRQGKAGVAATWGVQSSQGIVSFLVQRTYEDPNDEYAVWEDVTTAPCTGSRSYKCTDSNVYPGYLSYRVIASKGDGSTVSSAVVTAHIASH